MRQLAIYSRRYSLTRQQIFDGVCAALLPQFSLYPPPSDRRFHISVIGGTELCSPLGAVLPRECFVRRLNFLPLPVIYRDRVHFRRPGLIEWLDANYRSNERFWQKIMRVYRALPAIGWVFGFRTLARGYQLNNDILTPYLHNYANHLDQRSTSTRVRA